MLPNQDLRENINQLESLFGTSVEYITDSKLTPIAPEKINTDTKIAVAPNDPLVKLPRVSSQPTKVKEKTLRDPEILLNKISYKTVSPKILHSVPNNQSAEAYRQDNFQKELPDRRYPTRTKVDRAASTVQQLEAA